MTDAERLTSSTATGSVGWDGNAVRATAPSTLGNAPALLITSPASIAGSFDIQTAQFGPDLATPGVSGEVAAAVDASDAAGPTTTDACSDLANAAELVGKSALVDRGTCPFGEKAAGSGGGRHRDDRRQPRTWLGTSADGRLRPVHRSCVGITQSDGASIRANLDAGVAAELGLDPRHRAGTGLGGRVLLYAPNPSEPGSSTSHFDTSAFPSLLMEPNLTGALPHDVDLTLPLFRDIGWSSDTVPTPAPREAVIEVGGDAATQALPPRP
jgi:hypothetical protein